MENFSGTATSIPQVNDPDGLAEMLALILRSPRTNQELMKGLELKPRELSYRLAALRFFSLIRKTGQNPSMWEFHFHSDDTSGLKVPSASQILRYAILKWNNSSLGLKQDLSSSEYEIWTALAKDNSKPVGEVTMGRRVSSYKKLVRWAIEMET